MTKINMWLKLYNQAKAKGLIDYTYKGPINSTFTKEISKKFQRIFNPQTTFEDIQNLQEESIMGSHVDNFLKEVLKKENDNGQKTSKVARTVRQVHNERTRLVKEAVSNQGKKKSSGLEITSS
jgi:hypothetical protein